MMASTNARRGLVHIYTGNGKGKTTASIGLVCRASGAGMKCLFCQFLKGRDTSELEPLRALGVDILRTEEVKKFIPQMDAFEKKECVQSHEVCYNKMKALALSGIYDLVVLDEVIAAAGYGFVPLADLCGFLRERPAGLEVVLTGRNAPAELLALADYVSEIQPVKHPFEAGIAARKGIEF